MDSGAYMSSLESGGITQVSLSLQTKNGGDALDTKVEIKLPC